MQNQNQNQNPSQQQCVVVAEAPDARLYRLVKNQRTKLSSGPVKLCWLNDARMYFLGIDEFCQFLYPTTPLVSLQTDKGISLIFPHITEGLNGIFIPGQPAQTFCFHLSKIVQVIPFQNAILIPQFKTSIDLHCQDILKNPLDVDIEAISYIQKGGDAAKKGFLWLGTAMAEGINKGGQYIHSKIDKQEEVEVSDETKLKYAAAKQAASHSMKVTGTYLGQLFKPVAEKAKEIKNDLNKKIDESNNKTLKDGRQVAIATWDATGNALGGLGQALSQVGDTIGNNTKMCVDKRYGEDVTETFLGENQYDQINFVEGYQQYQQYSQALK